ncbi:hypothetical protein AAMO2058_000508100 [Amorphochlora amoebiformis]
MGPWVACMTALYTSMLVLYTCQVKRLVQNSRIRKTYYLSIAYVCDALLFTMVVAARWPWQLEVVVDSLVILFSYCCFLYIGQQYCEVNYRIATAGQIPKHTKRVFFFGRVCFALCIILSGVGQISFNEAWWRTFQFTGTSFLIIVFGFYCMLNLFYIRHRLVLRLRESEQAPLDVNPDNNTASERPLERSYVGELSKTRIKPTVICSPTRATEQGSPTSDTSMIRRHASSSLPTTNRDASSGHTTTNRDTSSNHVVTTRETSPIQVVTKRDTWPGHSVTNRGATINLSLEMKRHSPSVKSHTNLTTTRSATVAIITDNMRRDFKRYRNLKFRVEVLMVILVPVLCYRAVFHTWSAYLHALLSESAQEYIETRRTSGMNESLFAYLIIAIVHLVVVCFYAMRWPKWCPRIPSLCPRTSTTRISAALINSSPPSRITAINISDRKISRMPSYSRERKLSRMSSYTQSRKRNSVLPK